jgi:enoyl-CoA hydratase/carnithine racemase
LEIIQCRDKDSRVLITIGEDKIYSNGLDLNWIIANPKEGAVAVLTAFHKITARFDKMWGIF